MNREQAQKLLRLARSWHVPTKWLLLLVAAVSVLLYLNVLPNTFIFDDWQQIVDNPFLRRGDALRQIFTTGVWQFLGPVGVSNFYRPLMHALFYADLRLFGMNPAGYHAVSILLHALVSLMVFMVLHRVTRHRLTALFAALLFGAHPVHTESVAWISAYPELLSALLSLLTMWLYLRAEQAAGPARRLLLVSAGPVLLLALLSKEIAVAVPVLLVVYELLAGRGSAAGFAARSSATTRPIAREPWRSTVARVWPAYLSAALAMCLYLAARIHALGALMPAGGTRPLPLDQHVWTAIAVFARYLWVQAAPLRLHAFYYLPPSTSPRDPLVIAGAATMIGCVVLGWWLWRRRRTEAFAVPLYLLPVAPALLLPYASVGLLMAERYLYLASVGFCWLLGAAFAWAVKHWKWQRVVALFVVVLMSYSVRTVVRNRDWRDEIRFYQQTIADFPGFPRAYLNLGEALMRRDRLDEARDATRQAARLDPAYPDPHVNLGLIYRGLGDNNAAIEEFRQAAQLAQKSRNPFVASRSLTDLGVSFRAAGRLSEAVTASRLALVFDPFFAGGHNNLAYALLLERQNIDEAIQHLNEAVRLDPTMDVAYSNLGLAYSIKSDWGKAQEYLLKAARLNPSNAETHARLGEVHLAQGRVREGIRELQLALMLDPQNERARAAHPPTEGQP